MEEKGQDIVDSINERIKAQFDYIKLLKRFKEANLINPHKEEELKKETYDSIVKLRWIKGEIFTRMRKNN